MELQPTDRDKSRQNEQQGAKGGETVVVFPMHEPAMAAQPEPSDAITPKKQPVSCAEDCGDNCKIFAACCMMCITICVLAATVGYAIFLNSEPQS